MAGSRSLLSKALLVLQVAISLVLLIAAGLFLRTLQNLRNVDVGFNTRNLVLFRVNPSLNRYDEARTVGALPSRCIERLARVAGVRSVALSNVQLLSGSVNSTSIFVQGRTYADGPARLDQPPRHVARLLRDDGDAAARGPRLHRSRRLRRRRRSSIINETAARKYFPNENPIGQRFGIERRDRPGRSRSSASCATPSTTAFAMPRRRRCTCRICSGRMPSAVFHVRTAGDPAGAIGAIRDAVRQIDPNLPLMNVSTQMETVEKRLQQERVFAQAYALFGALALLLASIGLFGLMSYSVARRTNEIGIRMALGAQRRDVLRLVMGESMMLVVDRRRPRTGRRARRQPPGRDPAVRPGRDRRG